MVCYCKRDIVAGGRTVSVDVRVDWGDGDERDVWEGGYVFCSFACCAAWASDRAADHDGRRVWSPQPSVEQTERVVSSAERVLL